jgi:hypothetical protein
MTASYTVVASALHTVHCSSGVEGGTQEEQEGLPDGVCDQQSAANSLWSSSGSSRGGLL